MRELAHKTVDPDEDVEGIVDGGHMMMDRKANVKRKRRWANRDKNGWSNANE
jgi:hypothetical protein